MFIYNETSVPFNIEECGNNIGLINKTLYKKNNKTNEMYKKKRHLLLTSDVINSIDRNILENTVNTKEIVNVSDTNKSIYFCKKDLSPLVSQISEGLDSNMRANILLASIDIGMHGKVIGLSHHRVLVLNSGIFGGELVLMTSFTYKSKALVLKVYDDVAHVLTKYIFKLKDDKIVVTVIKKEIELQTFVLKHIKHYVPNAITSNVVCYKQDLGKLSKVIDNLNLKFTIEHYEVTNKSIESVLVRLKENNIKAVTLFLDTDDLDNPMTMKIYGKLLSIAEWHISKIIILLNNSKTIKI